jgi:DNA processing protein
MLIHWLWYALRTGMNNRDKLALLERFQTAEDIFNATASDYFRAGLQKNAAAALQDKDLSQVRRIMAQCEEMGIGLVAFGDAQYPSRLKYIADPPMVLYYKGKLPDFGKTAAVGVVGTRHPSNYGIHAAKRISYDLARSGAVIVSGLATGIDAAAHRAALYHGSFTVGIIGCGIDKVYPKENAELYEEVIRGGLLMTEYPPGTAPMGKNFPVRNRLISALSDAVCVIEGSEQSGSLITAEDALKQGKGLYAVPGSIFARESAGSNFLLRIGAKPCLSAYDLIEDFRSRYPTLEGAVALFKRDEVKQKKNCVFVADGV